MRRQMRWAWGGERRRAAAAHTMTPLTPAPPGHTQPLRLVCVLGMGGGAGLTKRSGFARATCACKLLLPSGSTTRSAAGVAAWINRL